MFNGRNHTSEEVLAAEYFVSTMVEKFGVDETALRKKIGVLWDVIHQGESNVALVLDSKFVREFNLKTTIANLLAEFN